MTQERRGWFIVASLFVVLLLVFGGGYNTVPVFLPALLRAFPRWNHQRVSILPSVLAASAGICVLPVGWLVDRVETRLVMIIGGLAAGGSFLIASQAQGLGALVGAYALLGIGIAAGTVLPASLVIANWFSARRGLAMGIANSGSTIGGMVMTLVAGFAIGHWGWRAAYTTIGLPMLLVAVPLVVLAVRSRPAGGPQTRAARSAVPLEGFEAGAALRSRSFWMIVVANFCFAFSATGTAIHLIAHLQGAGFTSSAATLTMSLIFGFAAIGKVSLGLLADRITASRALAIDFAMQSIGVALIFTLGRPTWIPFFVLIYGLSVAAPLALLPLVTAESLGLRRFGLLSGLAGMAQTSGAAIGPLVSGRIFDLTQSYSLAFELFIVINLIGALASLWCRPYATESAPPLPLTAPVSA
jgi:MFS family permease